MRLLKDAHEGDILLEGSHIRAAKRQWERIGSFPGSRSGDPPPGENRMLLFRTFPFENTTSQTYHHFFEGDLYAGFLHALFYDRGQSGTARDLHLNDSDTLNIRRAEYLREFGGIFLRVVEFGAADQHCLAFQEFLMKMRVSNRRAIGRYQEVSPFEEMGARRNKSNLDRPMGELRVCFRHGGAGRRVAMAGMRDWKSVHSGGRTPGQRLVLTGRSAGRFSRLFTLFRKVLLDFLDVEFVGFSFDNPDCSRRTPTKACSQSVTIGILYYASLAILYFQGAFSTCQSAQATTVTQLLVDFHDFSNFSHRCSPGGDPPFLQDSIRLSRGAVFEQVCSFFHELRRHVLAQALSRKPAVRSAAEVHPRIDNFQSALAAFPGTLVLEKLHRVAAPLTADLEDRIGSP